MDAWKSCDVVTGVSGGSMFGGAMARRFFQAMSNICFELNTRIRFRLDKFGCMIVDGCRVDLRLIEGGRVRR